MSLLERDMELDEKKAGKDSPSSMESSTNRSEWRTELFDWLKTFAIAFAVVMVLHFFVFNLSTVEGHSMEPTLTENEWLFVNKWAYLVGKPKVGDVVILKEPDTGAKEKKFLVKRVVGVPGDRIQIHNKRLYRNGELVEEPYTDSLIEDMSYGPEVISEGHYFVMGDNRHARASLDSRSFHAVPDELINGRADYILWPYKEFRAL
ncbi:signal peptidase I [Paenibacillus prosopidis]|uniref:Signal peptidase I n=1 Tax=Paenibacillus prosopidis TaxID=630520 RepID=A0A368WAT9_9BACL|nr:signal peptidase I [Paenibacillus prosopidis]RCW51828.1 signal peptidase I [Paenibacillus prosopidis]